MSVLIIALPRTGSTELGRKLSIEHKLKYEFEPFNPILKLPYIDSYKNNIVKTMIFHTPVFIKEHERLDWLIRISNDFKKTILLSRKDLIACTESWSFLLYQTINGFKSNQPYMWKKTPNYDDQLLFIKKCNEELNYLSTVLNIPITYYEDIYDVDDINKLRKGNRDLFDTKII